MKLKRRIKIIIEKDGNGFHAYCTVFKGLHIDGDTIKETINNMADAVDLYLDTLKKHGDSIPIGCIE